MGSSEHPLQQYRSGWPLCAIWDPYVAGGQKANSQIPPGLDNAKAEREIPGSVGFAQGAHLVVLKLPPYDRQKSMPKYMPVMKPLQPPLNCRPEYLVQRPLHSSCVKTMVIRPNGKL